MARVGVIAGMAVRAHWASEWGWILASWGKKNFWVALLKIFKGFCFGCASATHLTALNEY